MKENLIKDIVQRMLPYLNNEQMEKLQSVLYYTIAKYEVIVDKQQDNNSERNYVELFLTAKRIEGCSEKSLNSVQLSLKSSIASSE